MAYVDGQNIAIDNLSADGRGERLPTLVADCVRLKADVIVATTTPGAQAAKNATRTIPIVLHALGDPVATGLVASLARPGGNVTGVTSMSSGFSAKRLALLKEAAPRISRVLVLAYLVDPIAPTQIEQRLLPVVLLAKLKEVEGHQYRRRGKVAVVDMAEPLEAGDKRLIEDGHFPVERESGRAELGQRGDQISKAPRMVAAVTTDQAHPALFLNREHAPPVVLLFIDPPGHVEGPGYLGGVHEERRIGRSSHWHETLSGHPRRVNVSLKVDRLT